MLILLAAAAAVLHFTLRPAPAEGVKTVTVEITHGDGSVKTVEIRTDAGTLRAALDQEHLIAGQDSSYGFFITAVDGETADSAKQQWWGFTRDGAYVETGVDDTVIADGDHYEFTLNEGY